MTPNKIPSLQGPMYILADGVDNAKEVGIHIQQYIDKYGKPPEIIAVNVNAPEVKLPERFIGLDVTILHKAYVHHPKLLWLGRMV